MLATTQGLRPHCSLRDTAMTVRNLILVLGDQLDADSCAFDGFDAQLDRVWMAEVAEESTHVWSSKQRTALFLSAMRYFAQALRSKSISVDYRSLPDEGTPPQELNPSPARPKQELRRA